MSTGYNGTSPVAVTGRKTAFLCEALLRPFYLILFYEEGGKHSFY